MKHWPHTATISWLATVGTYSSVGVYVESTNSTVASIICNVQPNISGAKFTQNSDGDEFLFKYIVNCPKIGYSVPWKTQLVNFAFEGKNMKVVSLFGFQKHSELQVD